MKRPSAWNDEMFAESARRWVAAEARNHRETVGEGASADEAFARCLAAAGRRGAHIDAASVAAEISRSLHCPVDEELLEIADEYLSTHEAVHTEAVRKWAAGWGPALPFSGHGRVTVTGGRDGPRSGLGREDKRYGDTAQLLFMPDGERAASLDAEGQATRWHIVRIEDISGCEPLTEEDLALIERDRAVSEVRDTEYRRQGMMSKARADFGALVAASSQAPDADDRAAYDRLAGTPEKAAALVAALTRVARAELMDRPREDAPPPGRLL